MCNVHNTSLCYTFWPVIFFTLQFECDESSETQDIDNVSESAPAADSASTNKWVNLQLTLVQKCTNRELSLLWTAHIYMVRFFCGLYSSKQAAPYVTCAVGH